MRIIPVIDLKAGQVVRAAGGDRHKYQPWRSPICPNAEPLEAVAGFLRLHPFPTFYIADLDAIEGLPSQRDLLTSINHYYPDIKIWMDSGLTARKVAMNWRKRPWLHHVLGTESMREEDMHGLKSHILSLDFKKGRIVGPFDLQFNITLWPEDVILMNLDDVGSQNGPNSTLLEFTRPKSPDTRLYAAGGIRNTADLVELKNLGINGALVATALHEGAIGAAQLDDLAAK
ncbi:MAG: HisA/HisF-related TIM barrel protein [Hyphomicrobiales bacterium]|nr:HisA/HisF-related TIM barrel protein [Hyphomicrobiales bacterium]